MQRTDTRPSSCASTRPGRFSVPARLNQLVLAALVALAAAAPQMHQGDSSGGSPGSPCRSFSCCCSHCVSRCSGIGARRASAGAFHGLRGPGCSG